MIKAVNITFDLDTDSGTVKNVKCTIEGEVKRKTTTRKKSEVMEPYSVVERLDTKLVFNNKALDELGAEAGDRIPVTYKEIDGLLKPVISVSDTAGNKLTKSQTVLFRGDQNTVLAEFGDQFTLEPLGEGQFKLISKSETTEETTDVKAEVIINDNFPTSELDELTYEATESDDLTDIDVLQFKL